MSKSWSIFFVVLQRVAKTDLRGIFAYFFNFFNKKEEAASIGLRQPLLVGWFLVQREDAAYIMQPSYRLLIDKQAPVYRGD